MSTYTIYYAPGTCARVAMISMYEAGVEFEPRLVKFMKGEHRSPEYLSMNPKGKVPTLLIDNKPLTENIAILSYLAKKFPQANLLPLSDDPITDARIYADLSWCSSGIHPLVTRIRLPQFFCDIDGGAARVKEMAENAIRREFSIIEGYLNDCDWFYDTWSSMDAYLYWVWFRVTGAGMDCTSYENYQNHAIRMEQRDSVIRLNELESQAMTALEKEGLNVRFEKVTK